MLSCGTVDVSTIHSFCEKLLRTHGAATGIPNTFTIKSYRQETREIVTRHINEFKDSVVFREISPFKIVDLVMELLHDNGNKGLVIGEKLAEKFPFATLDNEFFNNFKQAFIKIYSLSETEIIQRKANENIMTPNDLITFAARLLDDPKVSARIRSWYKYVFVDEFQVKENADQFIFIEK